MSWGTPTNAAKTLSKPVLPDTIKKQPDLTHTFETILMYGKKGTGKTTAAGSVIDEAIKADPKVTIFYVSTDGGFGHSFKYYFGAREAEVMKNVRLYEPFKFKENKGVPLFTQIAAMFHEINDKAKPSDWLIVDIADKFWTWAQDTWIEQSAPQNSPTTYMTDAAKDVKRFMEFNRSQWQFIKRLDNFATFNVIENAKCNILYITSEGDVDLENDDDKKKKEIDDVFDLVGCRPNGQKLLPYSFNTVVYLSGLMNKKFFTLCDRGYTANFSEHPYGENWFVDFLKSRTKEK